MKKIIGIFLLTVSVSFGSETYQIAEPDAYEEFMNSEQKAVEKFKKMRDKVIEQWLNLKGEETTPAEKNYRYEIDPTYVLQNDIPRVDKDGNVIGILYPKGYKFNPLEYMNQKPEPMIVFNPCIEKERQFVKRKIKNLGKRVLLVASNCPAKDIKDEYGYPVYLLVPEIVKRFHIKNTVSIITANMEKKVMEVEVFKVK